jgi:imidazole glycerol-phosphate synthase subunit HisH
MSARTHSQLEIAVVDYGMGNRRSVEKALEHVGARARVSSDPAALNAADGLVLPGVGAFPRAMSNLGELGLDEFLRDWVLTQERPLLGVCLGMQLAFEHSPEQGGAAGLGIVPGEVRVLEHGSLKLPHIGWNEVRFRDGDSPLLAGLPAVCAFYHVHSFAPAPAEERDALGIAEYGTPFVSAVARGSFHGVQFHPEKSSAAGLRMLANFAQICAGARAPATL